MNTKLYTSYGELGENDRVVLMWSGGADSTLALVKYLEEHSADNLTVVSVVHAFIDDNKTRAERRVRTELRQKIGMELKAFHQIEVRVGYDFLRKGQDIQPWVPLTPGVHQPGMWLGNLMEFVSPNGSIALGYIEGDCFWRYADTFTSAFESFSEMMGLKNASIVYPVAHYSKWEVLEALHKRGLLDMIWTCELTPNGVDVCYDCVPCRNYGRALYELSLDDNKVWAQERFAAWEAGRKLSKSICSEKVAVAIPAEDIITNDTELG